MRARDVRVVCVRLRVSVCTRSRMCVSVCVCFRSAPAMTLLRRTRASPSVAFAQSHALACNFLTEPPYRPQCHISQKSNYIGAVGPPAAPPNPYISIRHTHTHALTHGNGHHAAQHTNNNSKTTPLNPTCQRAYEYPRTQHGLRHFGRKNLHLP